MSPVLASACGGPSAPAGREAAPLAGARMGGAFSLIDQDGRRVTDRDFAGRYRAVYFGYSFCPDVCPLDLQTLMAGYRLFARDHADAARRLQPIFVSVDPGRDTPAVLKPYVAAFGTPLIGLTGPAAEVEAVAKRYGVYAQVRHDPGATDYLVDHSRMTVLYGPEGQPIAMLPTDGKPAAVAAEMARWVR